MRAEARLLLAALLALGVTAQARSEAEWKEQEAPAPPALRLSGLIPLDMPSSGLRFGVDPASVTVGDDAVVRYVVVATSGEGAVNALYEGLRCGTAEVRTYARHDGKSGWVTVQGGQWQSLANAMRHSRLIAYTAACDGKVPWRRAADVVRELSSRRGPPPGS
ncbi:MAG TPA: CNP1-like family protein [Ramlibacter sp.]|nr:CNP1-like family protein [Ramlibacter sp.]